MADRRFPRPTVHAQAPAPAADPPADDGEDGNPADGRGALLPPSAPQEMAPQPGPHVASPTPIEPGEKPPWWWFTAFLIIFGMFSILLVVLVATGQSLTVALGVPGALSAAALGVLSSLRRLAYRRRA